MGETNESDRAKRCGPNREYYTVGMAAAAAAVTGAAMTQHTQNSSEWYSDALLGSSAQPAAGSGFTEVRILGFLP